MDLRQSESLYGRVLYSMRKLFAFRDLRRWSHRTVTVELLTQQELSVGLRLGPLTIGIKYGGMAC